MNKRLELLPTKPNKNYFSAMANAERPYVGCNDTTLSILNTQKPTGATIVTDPVARAISKL